MTFEKNIARLEEIVGELDADAVELDRALHLFEEGVEELRAASTELARAEAQVKTLSESAAGVMELTDFRA